MLYAISVPFTPPTQNQRLQAMVKRSGPKCPTCGQVPATGAELKRRKGGDGSKAFQEQLGLFAKAQLRAQGLLGPLEGPVLALVVQYVPNGRRDSDSGTKDVLDGLEGIAWTNDRQIVCAPAFVDNRATERKTAVWFGPMVDIGEWFAACASMALLIGGRP